MKSQSSEHEDWDYDNLAVVWPRAHRTSVYSVRFAPEEIRAIRAAAAAAGKTTSQFIRDAAIGAVSTAKSGTRF